MNISILKYRKWIIIWITPFLLSTILFLSKEKESKCVFVVLLMVVYWLTEAVPLAVTSLIPVFMFPLLDIMSTKQVSNSYINETLMVFLGSIIATVAIEESNLHQRIALKILMLFGTSPVWLLLGFMSTTAFISIWISDTATTALMVPIIEAVVVNIRDHRRKSTHNQSISLETISSNSVKNSEIKIKIENERKIEEKSFKLMRRVIYLAVTFSSLIGGTGSITGTTSNMIFKGLANNLDGDNITFGNWMMFSIPGLVINVFLIWIYMISVFGRKFPKTTDENQTIVKTFLKNKYKSLGTVSFHETAVLVVFSLLLMLWFFRAPDFCTGWSPLLHPQPTNYINDATATMFVVFLCFVIPSKPQNLQKSDPLMTWKAVQEKMPWGVFLLFGGAFAMSSGIKESGLSDVIGQKLMYYLQDLSPLMLSILVSTLCMFFTEVSSNAATSTIFLPIVRHLAESLRISPLRLMLPVTLVSSFAFMFPAGAPTNAIVYEAAKLKIPEMAIPGFFAKFICLAVVIVSTNTWGYVVYNMHDLKPNPMNETLY